MHMPLNITDKPKLQWIIVTISYDYDHTCGKKKDMES